MARRVALLCALALLAAAPVAHADGDPASDYLLGQPSFIPSDADVPSAYANQLNDVLREAKLRGYEIRVALIATRYDMGSVTVLFRQPKRYARFLGQELFFVYKGNLLVVMPNGLAVSRGGKPLPADQPVVDRLPRPAATGAGLAAAATRAVDRLAANHGAIVPVPPLSGNTSTPNANRDRLTIAGGAVVLILVFGASAFGWRRLRGSRA